MTMPKQVAAKAQREPLSPERIEVAALDLIERESLAAFSTRKLAAELGCEAMSIYHYFPSKGHLLDALVDRVMGTEMTRLDPHPTDWRRRLEASAREWRGLAKRRPHFFGYLVMHRLNTPRALHWLDGIIGLFGSLGIGVETGARMFRVFGFYLGGALLEETAGYAQGHSTVEPMPAAATKERYPHVDAAGPWFQEKQWEATFELGLRVLLDSIERMIDRRLL
jgi:AcrR family transcriptional regulator